MIYRYFCTCNNDAKFLCAYYNINYYYDDAKEFNGFILLEIENDVVIEHIFCLGECLTCRFKDCYFINNVFCDVKSLLREKKLKSILE